MLFRSLKNIFQDTNYLDLELLEDVVIEFKQASLDNIILDTCRENEAVMDFAENVFRGIPCLSQSAELS